jgi:hypothetical protein
VDVFSALSLGSLSDENYTATVQPYGKDNVGIGRVGKDSSILQGQTIAGLVSKTFPMALFSLSNAAFNLGKGKTTTFLTTLREALDNFPSTSLSYTAGCYARGWPASLVLSRYDFTRFNPSTTLAVDLRDTTAVLDAYQFTVNVTAININVNDNVGSDTSLYNPRDTPVYIDAGMAVNIDPLTPQIWVPRSACDAFEKAFRLEWDDIAKLYLVNESTHDWLVQLNRSITFSLSSSRSNGKY